MAHTRQLARVSDQPSRRSRLGASRTPSIADEDHHVDVVEIAESVDAGSPRSSPAPAPGTTTAVCTRCDASAGDFFNSWHRITNSYYLPALLGSYSSLLRPEGRTKGAKANELSGCLIQPLACPNCNAIVGFHVVDAPPERHFFVSRDFFKLTHLRLRCKVHPHHFEFVEPVVVPLPTMEIDSRPPPPFSGPTHSHYSHHDAHHRHFESSKPSLPPMNARSPPAPLPLHAPLQKSPGNPPLPSPSTAVQTVHDIHHVQPPKQSPKPTTTIVPGRRELPPVPQHSHSPVEPRINSQSYPRPPQEVQLDAIERLQTQVSQNSSALIAQTRDLRSYEEKGETIRQDALSRFHHQANEIRRVDEAVGRLQHEMLGIRELLETLSREVHATREIQARGGVATPGHPLSGQDTALELMAQQMAVMSHKANEVDTLKITIEIMKNKIQRLEDVAAGIPPPQPASQYASPREPAARVLQAPHAASYHGPPSQAPQIDIPVPSVQRTQSFHSHGSQSVAATPEAQQRAEPPQAQSGWATVNAGTKRTHPNGIDSPQDSTGQSIGSPKRPKLAPIEPRGAYASSQAQPLHVYDHMDTDDSDAARMHTHSHTLPSQPGGTASQPTLTSQRSQFIPYSTQDAPSDDSWRPESQRISDARTPRARGRGGGGPGSRGGRVRKSIATHLQHPLGTPEWERDDWVGIPESQPSPDGFYGLARSRGIVRRGSGGGGTSRGGRPSSSGGRSVSLGLQGVTGGVAMGMPVDPYAHTKKTRTKPIRNADGVLIRKDGRPDMRSQSSAANLRKVHARKEEHKDSDHPYTPTPSHLQHSVSASGAETPSPTAYSSHDVSASQQKKHNHVMSKMFPGGVDEAAKEHDFARKVFDEDQDHTAHPRIQHHHHHAPRGHARDKREHADESRTPNDGDMDMDRPEDHADDEGQTPSGQSDNSGRESQYHDAAENEPQPQEARKEHAAAPHSTMNSSHTVKADPM